MLNAYFKIGDFICHVDCYDRETGLWGYCCDEIPVLNGWTCENLMRRIKFVIDKQQIIRYNTDVVERLGNLNYSFSL